MKTHFFLATRIGQGIFHVVFVAFLFVSCGTDTAQQRQKEFEQARADSLDQIFAAWSDSIAYSDEIVAQEYMVKEQSRLDSLKAISISAVKGAKPAPSRPSSPKPSFPPPSKATSSWSPNSEPNSNASGKNGEATKEGKSENTVQYNQEPGGYRPNDPVPVGSGNPNAMPDAVMASPKPVVGTLTTPQGSKEQQAVPQQTGADAQAEMEPLQQPTLAETFKNYNVILKVDSAIKSHEKGELVVWIGATGMTISVSKGQVKESVEVPARIGQTAMITPFAPGFTISPAETQCIAIDPSGSEVRFELTPSASGNWKVTANIKFFNSPDCIGTPVPKSSATLSVTVVADVEHQASLKLSEMGAVLWSQFMDFWGAFLALLFGTVLFVFRKKIKSLFGFDQTK